MPEKKTFVGLQALRAIAASLVLVQHSLYFSLVAVGADTLPFRQLQLGMTGVLIFFVISGAVMALATTDEGSKAFALSRLTRIYPAYFLALCLAYIVLSADGVPPQFAPDASLLLVPTGTLNSELNVPYWTLIYEMQFYFLLWVATLCRATHLVRMWLAVGWAFIILAAGAAGIDVPAASPTATQIPFAALNLFFVLGYVMASGMMTREWRPFFALVLLTATATLFANAWTQFYLAQSVLCAAAVFVGINISSGLVPRWMAKVGDYSYGLYLAHLAIVVAIYELEPGWPLWAMISVTLSCGLLGGLAFGRAEQWLYKRYWRPMSKTAVSVSPAVQL
ncbi:acyltransferase [Mesorhizobium sp. M00.F.Ca.ET.170.01.1.1]|nr:acyltransferase [Mesorhizobium sp. M00.F.Ca.ET.170.01.1.1]